MDNNKMYNTANTTQDQKQQIWILEGRLRRAEKSAQKHQSDASHWMSLCRKAEAKLADIGQEAYDRGYVRGIGVGLMVGCVATIIDAKFWKKILKQDSASRI